ncbi:hypothetical protein CFP56_008267 [Quercus suber]|uniref:Uncharacterized protein n=1 Tax=Quercus suber TaxID=58331 RepID=A0AAW0L4I3_QUESU
MNYPSSFSSSFSWSSSSSSEEGASKRTTSRGLSHSYKLLSYVSPILSITMAKCKYNETNARMETHTRLSLLSSPPYISHTQLHRLSPPQTAEPPPPPPTQPPLPIFPSPLLLVYFYGSRSTTLVLIAVANSINNDPVAIFSFFSVRNSF